MLHHPHYYPCLKSVPILRIHLSICSARNKWTNAIMNHILASRVNCHISCKKEGHLQNYSAVALATLGLISREWRSGAGCKSFMEHRNGSLSQLNISRRYWSGSLKHYLLLSAVCYWLEHFVGLFHCALYILISCLFIPTASRRQYWKQINNSTCNSFYTLASIICGCRSYWSQQEHCIQSQSNCGQCKYADNRILLQIRSL